METLSAVLSLCEGKPPVTDGFSSQTRADLEGVRRARAPTKNFSNTIFYYSIV